MTRPRLVFLLLLSSLASLHAAEYVGADACTPCHSAEAAKQSTTHHAHALHRIAGSTVGDFLLEQARSPDGALHYTADGQNVHVSGPWTDENPIIEWAFGAAVQGSTPVGHLGEQYFEHRFSYYSRIHALAPTFGHPRRVSAPLAELGMLQDPQTITSCFNCHGTGVQRGPNGPDLAAYSPGVRCERCHGPGSSHIQAATQHAAAAAIDRQIVNPGRLPAKALIEICGQCHRLPTVEMGAEPELENPITVRFAPVGLLASRCFNGSRGKLSCLTCHDPHADAQPRTAMSYTEKCLACHAASKQPIKLCRRRQRENCLTCHMQQSSLGPYLRFTDHRIRVYSPD
ncbi:MAG TPA: multiheme c-type cytochrome [Bryobacteraceae bacterium]|nr:multiheme c-type cytochrome [Bryobacteraceae bacterium]